MTTQDNSASGMPAPATAALQRLIDAELSLSSRLGYVALLLAASIMTAIIASLWLTEPALPLRTRLAFLAMIVIGLSWAIFAAWALTHRRMLLARHGIVAGRLAVTFTSVFVTGALVVGYATGRSAPYLAAMMGTVMAGAAVALLMQAHRTFTRLTERKQALERELGRDPR